MSDDQGEPDSGLDKVRRRIAATTASWAGAASLTEIRNSFDALFADEADPTIDPINIGRMPAAWITTSASCIGRVVLFCHGGGFQVGSIRSHAGLMRRLADVSRARVLGFDYRLAPEHRFPAAVDDAFASYLWLLDQGITPERMAVAGDSAGAALAINLVLRARDRGLALPACLVLISPWLDLTLRGDSYSNRAALDIFSRPQQLAAMARSYLGRHGDATDPSASPVEADLTGLPPTCIHAGDHDITLDDTFLLARRARACGANVQIRVWDGMFHHFQMFGSLRESKQSMAELGRFIIERTPSHVTS